jgi:hypothetical protein
MPDGQLLCINQTSHGLMAEQFCRHWGNAEFAQPWPYDVVMLGISQHDTGWYEWECAPRLCPDGKPMDFLHYPDVQGKADLWRRSVRRTWAQHPYAGLLVARHAALLYEVALDRNGYPEPEQRIIQDFLDEVVDLQETARRLLADIPELRAAMQSTVVEANTQLLQFGDRASLQVSIPWPNQLAIPHCPVDGNGAYTTIHMEFDDELITFDPWPYSVPEFTVELNGYLLPKRRFADEAEYHDTLSAAPYFGKSWRVTRKG